jgi:hypothetical protein
MYSMSWLDLYRQISALAMDLKDITDSNEADESTAKRGSRFLLDTLDGALNARIATPPQLETAVVSSPTVPSAIAFPSPLGAEMDGIMTLDDAPFNDAMNYLDAADIADLDFSLLGQEWIT